MSKNANGEGSIYKRTRDGKVIGYAGALSYVDENDTTKRHTVYGRTRAEVRTKLNSARDRLNAGAPVKDASRTVGEWMRQWRSTTLAVSDRKESTRVLYEHLSRRHLETAPFGDIRLDRLRPTDVEALVLTKRAGGDGVKSLADSTVRQVYTVLRAGLDGAVRDGLLASNPCAKVKRPGVARQEAKYLPAGDVQKVLKAAESSRYFTVLVLIASTGLRKGEALGLSWDRVDLGAGALTVTATLGRIGKNLVVSEPKTARSRRTVPLSPAVVAMLRRHKVTQSEDRLRAGNVWQDSGLVFTTEFGGPVDPRNLLRVLEVAATSAGIDKVGVHTLRHSAAVAWLEGGVHIKAVADLLGHSSIAITGDTYGHTSDDTARSAVAGLSEVLGL